MWTRSEIEQIRAMMNECISDADEEIVDAIRRNNGHHGSREALLSELDVLEKVRERLNVRFERIGSGS